MRRMSPHSCISGSDAPPGRCLPGVAGLLRVGVRLRAGPAADARFPAAADRRQAGARCVVEWAETGDPGTEVTGDTNAWGDHIGHTSERAEVSRAMLAVVQPHHASQAQIEAGYGSSLIAEFTRWAGGHGIRVIGGPPTQFSDSPIAAA